MTNCACSAPKLSKLLDLQKRRHPQDAVIREALDDEDDADVYRRCGGRSGKVEKTDEIWVRETVNTNFMEAGVLLVVSTGFAPGSIHGLTLFYVHGYFAFLIQYDLWYEAFSVIAFLIILSLQL